MSGSYARWISAGILAFVAVFALVSVSLIAPRNSAGAQDGATVSIVDFAFDPAQIDVAAGTTVTWTNNGSAPHTVTADDGSFDSGELAPGESFSFTFDTAGTFAYHCEIHPEMTAAVVVGGAAGGETQAAVAQETPAGEEAVAAVETPEGGRGDRDENAPVALGGTGSGSSVTRNATFVAVLAGLATVTGVAAVAISAMRLRRRAG